MASAIPNKEANARGGNFQEEFGSSGTFEGQGASNRQEEFDLGGFTAPQGLAQDATPEEILNYDPVQDSMNQWEAEQERQRVAREASEQAASTETLATPETPPAAPEPEIQAAQAQVDSLFDPAVNPPEPTTPPEQQAALQGQGQLTPQQAAQQGQQAPIPQASIPGVPPVPAAPDQVALLTAQNQALQAQLAQLTTQVAQMQQPQPAQAQYAQQQAPAGAPAQQPYGQPTPEQQEPLPNYQYQIAPQIVQAIQSEDPGMAAQGLQVLVSEVATAVHRQVRDEYRGYVNQQVPQLAQTQYQENHQRETAARQMREDFFGSYPQFGSAAGSNQLDPVIASTASQVMRDLGLREWNDVVKNTVAVRLHTMLGGQQSAPAVQQQQPGIPAAVQPAQAALAAQGTRAGAASPANPRMAEHGQVADLLYGFAGVDHPTAAFG